MKFKDIVSLFTPSKKKEGLDDFHQANIDLIFFRLRLTSIGIILFYSFYLYANFVLYKDVEDLVFRQTLLTIHTAGFLLSILFLFIHRIYRKKKSFFQSKWPSFIVYSYMFCYILMGVAASINSQRLTGNIDAYVIIVISVAVLFPLRPVYFFPILFVNHIVFLSFLSIVSEEPFSIVSKQINTTATVLIALLVSLTFYSYRRNNFANQVKLKESEKNLQKLFAINPFPLLLIHQQSGNIIILNNNAVEYFGMSVKDISKLTIRHLLQIEDDCWNKLTETIEQAGQIKNYILEHPLTSETSRWILINVEMVEFSNENCLLFGITDITELKKIEKELTLHASIDPLTGVMNRRGGIDILQNLLLTKVEFVICFVDINNLKVVNDNYGHAEGDVLIQSVCHAIKAAIRDADVLFRYGGDEFVILFFSKKPSDVEETWGEIEKKFESVQEENPHHYPTSSSYGLYRDKPGFDISLQDILEFAVQEMYRRKVLGKQEKE